MFRPKILRSLWTALALLNLFILLFASTSLPKEDLSTIYLVLATTLGLVGYIKMIFSPVEEEVSLIKWSYGFYLFYIINSSIIVF